MENKTNENEEIDSPVLNDSPLKSLNSQSNQPVENSFRNETITPQIGQSYSVQRIDGQWLSAVVLEKRELKSKPVEYFVHFENSKLKFLFFFLVNILVFSFILFYKPTNG